MIRIAIWATAVAAKSSGENLIRFVPGSPPLHFFQLEGEFCIQFTPSTRLCRTTTQRLSRIESATATSQSFAMDSIAF